MKLLKFSFLLLFLGSCFPFSNVDQRLPVRNYDEKIENDEDRDTVIDDTRSRFPGGDCEDQARDAECREQCKEMYRRRGDREDCEALTVQQVVEMFRLWELLEDPREDDLKGFDSDIFDLYLNISIDSLDDLIEDYKPSDAEEFLLWLLNDPDNAKIFIKEDNDYNSLDDLLNELESFDSDDIYKPFLENVDGDKFMELVVASGEEFIVEWFHNFINERNSACEYNTESKGCLKIYCIIGDGIDRDNRGDWTRYEVFEKYLEDIIDEKVNSRQGRGDNFNAQGWIHEDAPGNSRSQLGNPGDLDGDEWVDQLCQDLIN